MSGMLGIGGGVIVVPVLLWVFRSQGVSDVVISHTAVATSLAAIALPRSRRCGRRRRGAIDWGVIRLLAPGDTGRELRIGLVAGYIPAGTLKSLFGVFLL
jgi:uncharacterized membrane protein YfcA